MQGYMWAKTPEGELFVVLMAGGKGYVPGVEGAINLSDFFFLEPVAWPAALTPQSQNSPLRKLGVHAADVIAGSNILPFVANG